MILKFHDQKQLDRASSSGAVLELIGDGIRPHASVYPCPRLACVCPPATGFAQRASRACSGCQQKSGRRSEGLQLSHRYPANDGSVETGTEAYEGAAPMRSIYEPPAAGEPAGQPPYSSGPRADDPYRRDSAEDQPRRDGGHDPYGGGGNQGAGGYGGPYGQGPYGQGPGQETYGQSPYGQGPYGQGPYGQGPYSQGPYGQGPYGYRGPAGPGGPYGYGYGGVGRPGAPPPGAALP